MVNSVDNYCAAPFVALRLQQSGLGWGPCCAWRHEDTEPVVPGDYPDPLSHPGFADVRDRMLRGDSIGSCRLCDEARRDGLSSLREEFSERYGRPTEPRLQYLEVTFSNLCNLRCRMCGSGASTRWIADELRLGIKPTAPHGHGVEDLRVPLGDIRRLRVSGGEPLLEQDKVSALLEMISDARGGLSDLEFDMVSNGTVDISPRLGDLLSSCGMVFLQTSLDGLPEVNAYQRTGSSFRDIEPRIRLYNSMVGERFGHAIACSLGVLNIDGFTDFVDWIGDELPRTNFIIQPIYDPAWQALHNLPDPAKDLVRGMLHGWTPRNRSEHSGFDRAVRNLLDRPCELDPGYMLGKIAQMDALTGESFALVQPRMHEALCRALTH